VGIEKYVIARSPEGATKPAALPLGRQSPRSEEIASPFTSFRARKDAASRLQRVVDANLNRSREALRVCEDITRFVLDDKVLTKSLKDIRHKISRAGVGARHALPLQFGNIAQSRNITSDIGKKSSFDKSKPKNIKSLFYNNIHRAEESMRALEEFSKLVGARCTVPLRLSSKFKALRFKIYALEKKALKKLQTL